MAAGRPRDSLLLRGEPVAEKFICPKLLLPPPAAASETARAGSSPLPPSPLLAVEQGWGDLAAEWNDHAH